jgi:N,N'-diacetyllegionaminate synthase
MNKLEEYEKESKTFVIAEIGKNFIREEEERSVEQYLETAKSLILAAKEAGADAVKFQTHNVEDEQLDIDVISPHFKSKDRYSWVKRNTLATPLETFWRPLKKFCSDENIPFMSTPMSRGSAQILSKVGVGMWKIGSGDILDFVTLDYISKTGHPIIISSGMSTLDELDKAMKFLKQRNCKVYLLHCVSLYPCPPEKLNIGTIDLLKERYGVPVGFSDHSLEIDSSLLAVAKGATVIEKHFSFDRSSWGPDHKVSLHPDEFRELVDKIRKLEINNDLKQSMLSDPNNTVLLGTKDKKLQDGEDDFRSLFRKSLVASRDLSAGTKICADDMYAVRPQAFIDGLNSEDYDEVIGRVTKKDLNKYDPLTQDLLK